MRPRVRLPTLARSRMEELSEMPKVSRESAANVEHHGPVEDRHEDIDDYTVNFLTMGVTIDATPLFKGLPGDQCSCPHWGYVFKGRITYRFADHEEVFEAGRRVLRLRRSHAARRGGDRVRAVQPQPRTARRHRRDDEERCGARNGLIARAKGAAPEPSICSVAAPLAPVAGRLYRPLPRECLLLQGIELGLRDRTAVEQLLAGLDLRRGAASAAPGRS